MMINPYVLSRNAKECASKGAGRVWPHPQGYAVTSVGDANNAQHLLEISPFESTGFCLFLATINFYFSVVFLYLITLGTAPVSWC